MPLFEVMRENTKIILWVTVVAFVGLIFLAWGADFTSSFGGRKGQEPGVLARVNGQDILAREFSEAFEEARLMYEQQSGQRPNEEAEIMLRTSTWENLVERALVRHEVKRRGIIVTAQEVADALLQNPPRRFLLSPSFQTDGKFDIQIYQSWLTNPRTNTLPLELEQREQLEQAKLQLLLLAGVKVSEIDVREAWLQQNEKIDLTYAQIPYHRIQVATEVEDGALASYLAEHHEEFRLPRRTALEYIRLGKELSVEDSLDAYSEINDAFEELQHGENFAVLVQIYSEAPPSRRGGELGTYMNRDQFSRHDVREAAFSLEVGEASDIIVSADGFHLIKVEDRKTEDGVAKTKIAEIYVPRRMSYETNFALRDRAMDFADSAHVHGFRPAAEIFELNVLETGFFDPTGFVPGLRSMQTAKEFAAASRPGEISRPVETVDAWYVLSTAEAQPGREATLDDARASVQAAYLMEQRRQGAEQSALAILERCRNGTPLREAALAESLAVYNQSSGVARVGFAKGIGHEPKVTGAAFALDEPGLVPIAIQGNQGAFVVEVINRPEVDEEAYAGEKEELRMRLLREKQNRSITEWVRLAREKAEIDDYRELLVSM